MRLVLWLGVALALVAGVPASSAATGRSVPVVVEFWDAHHGLLAQSTWAHCSAPVRAERVSLERTSDVGRTWTPVLSVCASITGVGGEVTLATVATERALLVVPRGLLLTRDRGRSWSLLT